MDQIVITLAPDGAVAGRALLPRRFLRLVGALLPPCGTPRPPPAWCACTPLQPTRPSQGQRPHDTRGHAPQNWCLRRGREGYRCRQHGPRDAKLRRTASQRRDREHLHVREKSGSFVYTHNVFDGMTRSGVRPGAVARRFLALAVGRRWIHTWYMLAHRSAGLLIVARKLEGLASPCPWAESWMVSDTESTSLYRLNS